MREISKADRDDDLNLIRHETRMYINFEGVLFLLCSRLDFLVLNVGEKHAFFPFLHSLRMYQTPSPPVKRNSLNSRGRKTVETPSNILNKLNEKHSSIAG